jgi:cation transport regulator ChaB
MPYSSNEELPSSVKDAISSEEGQSLFREVVNERLDEGKSKEVAFASAWSALKNAGYEKQDGEWVKKAEYDGKDVELDKPFRLPEGSSKKFGVYVKDGDKVKKVTFGSPDMEIKRDDDEARENFRARHNCSEQTDKTSAAYWSCKMWQKGTSVSDVLDKRQVDDDVFTTEDEACTRSHDLGFGGEIHTYDTAEGQKVYMPGPSHEEYMGEEETIGEKETDEGRIASAVRAIMEVVMGKRDEEADYSASADIAKVNDEKRLVSGWASVIEENGEPVVDLQGDVISEEEMEKAAHKFVSDYRASKAMHKGDSIGQVVDSIALTREQQNALGVDLGKVGWYITVKVDDDEAWKKVKSGEFTGFSIGGKAKRNKV